MKLRNNMNVLADLFSHRPVKTNNAQEKTLRRAPYEGQHIVDLFTGLGVDRLERHEWI